MFFRALQIYRLRQDWPITLAQLEEQLQRGQFVRCPSNQPISRGWSSPRNDGALVHAQNQQWLIALTVEQRQLTAATINQEAAERAEQIAEQQGFPVGRKQMKEIKERVAEELLPRAFTKKRTTHAWLDRANGWLVIDAGSASRAEELIEHPRTCLDDFPLLPAHTTIQPCSAMADWLAGGDAPAGFTIDRDCELKSCAEEKAAVRYTRHPLVDEVRAEIKHHLAAGKLPTRLALTWDERISFVLTESMDIKRLAILDMLKEQAEKDADTAADQFEADFAIMTGELARFIPALIAAMGGIRIDLAEQGMAPCNTNTPNQTARDFARAIGGLYIHPQYSELTWSGRGRKPRWVEEWIGQGGSLDQLRVSAEIHVDRSKHTEQRGYE